MTIKEFIEQKLKIEDTLGNILSEYCTKYIKRMLRTIEEKYEEKRVVKQFQKYLIKISLWDREEKFSEYKNFLKWCLKKNLTETILQNKLDNFTSCTLCILFKNKPIELDFDKIIIEDLFSKSLKRIARHYYENPNERIRSSTSNNTLIINTLNSFIPFHKIIHLLEDIESKSEFDCKYDYKNTENTTTTTTTNTTTNTNTDTDTDIIKSLQYVPSEEIEYLKQQADKINIQKKDIEEPEKSIDLNHRKGLKNKNFFSEN